LPSPRDSLSSKGAGQGALAITSNDPRHMSASIMLKGTEE